MKNIIVTAGLLMIFLFFPLQYAVEQTNHNKKSELYRIVNTYKEVARIDGCFTDENIKKMTEEILQVFSKVKKEEIIVNVTKTPKYRSNEYDERGLIEFEVGVPVKNIIAMQNFWGLSAEENKYIEYVRGTAASELLP